MSKSIQEFQIQYGKSTSRQKKIFTSDGSLHITIKNDNAYIISLRDYDNKEIYKKQVPDATTYSVGKEISLGGFDIYIDLEKENIPTTIKNIDTS